MHSFVFFVAAAIFAFNFFPGEIGMDQSVGRIQMGFVTALILTDRRNGVSSYWGISI